MRNTESRSHGHAIAGCERLRDRDDFEKPSCLQAYTLLAATAFPDRIARQWCLAAGCDDFISKPFAIAAVETSLTNLLSGETPKTIAATDL